MAVTYQANLAEIKLHTVMPMEPGSPRGPFIPVKIYIEWSIAPATINSYVTATFEGGGEIHGEFDRAWTEHPSDQGKVIGLWLLKMEPVAPDM